MCTTIYTFPCTYIVLPKRTKSLPIFSYQMYIYYQFLTLLKFNRFIIRWSDAKNIFEPVTYYSLVVSEKHLKGLF